MNDTREAVIVGGGMAGLTAAAYLMRSGASVTLLEKEPEFGGLVSSFSRDGFTFDGGIRAVEDSGIVRPMLRQLGIDLEFLSSGVSVGYGDDIIALKDDTSLDDYRDQLARIFPRSAVEVDAIIAELRRVMGYMDVLYGIDNPLFLDLEKDRDYLVHTIMPWMLKYALTIPKVGRLSMPVDERLAALTSNRALIDMIGQHFFKRTPAFFALSYFSLYLDYAYPKGGTGSLPKALSDYIAARGGRMLAGRRAARIDVDGRTVYDSEGAAYRYDGLVWAADSKALYAAVDDSTVGSARALAAIAEARKLVAGKRGGESVMSVFLMVDLPPSYFASISAPHFFYTPSTEGLSSAGAAPEATDREATLAWLGRAIDLNTYEISIPALRDPSMAPPGKTGLIVSFLLDHRFAAAAEKAGWHERLKEFCVERLVARLDGSVYPGLARAVSGSFAATPLSLQRRTGNTDGAITGWSFENDPIPAVHELPKVARSVRTPIPGVCQAGQWTFSPSGLPISILTGKLAADRLAATMRKARRR